MVITNNIYEHYKKKASWTSHECVCLLKQLDPNKVKEEDIVNSEEQIFLNHLKTIKLTKCEDEELDSYNPMKFIAQAQIKGLKIPDRLKLMVTPTNKEAKYSWLDDAMNGVIKDGINPPYEDYKKKKYWKRYECIALLCGINCTFPFKTHKEITDHFTKECLDLDVSMEIAINCNKLINVGTPENKLNTLFEAIPFLKWADSVDLSIPEPFKEMINDKMDEKHKTNKDKNIDPHTRIEPQESDSPNNQKQSLLISDLEYENFSDEAKAVLMASKAFYMGKKDNSKLIGKGGHLTSIRKWVKENCPQDQYGKLYNKDGTICSAVLNRIAKTVNRNKSGGAPKTR